MTVELDTVTALAERLGVNRRRVAKWRKDEGAPDGLDLDQWRTWLHRTSRTTLAGRLDIDPKALPELAPEKPAGVTTEGASKDVVLDLAKPKPDASASEWEKYWKTYAHRERALLAASERQQAERVLIRVDEVAALLKAQATAQVSVLGDAVWLAMRPLLDGVPDSLRRALRTAHDQALADIRTRLAEEVRRSMRAAVTPSTD
jgi:transcriptional regulator with XRE-family HTH domain